MLTDDLVGAMGLPPTGLKAANPLLSDAVELPTDLEEVPVSGGDSPLSQHSPATGASELPDETPLPDESDPDKDALDDWLSAQSEGVSELIIFQNLYVVKSWLDLLTEPLFTYGTPPGVLIQWGLYQKVGLVSKVTAKVISMYKNGLPRILEVKIDLHSLDPRLLYGADDGALVTDGD